MTRKAYVSRNVYVQYLHTWMQYNTIFLQKKSSRGRAPSTAAEKCEDTEGIIPEGC